MLRAIILAVVVVLASASATAQQYPSKPIRLIVAFPAGGGSDLMARLVAQRLGERIGQSFVVDNRPGAGGSIGTEAAVKSPADGYTLQLGSTSEVSINRSLYSKLSYDPVKDLAPIGLLATTPMVIVVHPSLPVSDLKALVALAKAHPRQINYGSAGSGSTTHLAAELFRWMTQIEIIHIPYKGAPQALTDLTGGQLQLMFSTLPPALPLVQSHRLKALAVSSQRRVESLPNVPTVQEAGVAGYEVEYWYGLFAPRGTSADVIALLNRQLTGALRATELSSDIRKQGAEPATMTLEQFTAFVTQDAERWARAVKLSGARID